MPHHAACPAPAAPLRRARVAARHPATCAARCACARARAAASAGPDRGSGTPSPARAITALIQQPRLRVRRDRPSRRSSRASSDQMCSSAWCINSPRSRSLNPGTGRSSSTVSSRVSAKPRNAQRDCALKVDTPRVRSSAANGGAISSVNRSSAGAACSSARQCGCGSAGGVRRRGIRQQRDWARPTGRRRDPRS